MSSEKIREDFELAWSVAMSDDEGTPGNKPMRSKHNPETYAGDAAEFAWKWWKRSRAAIEVELPKVAEYFDQSEYPNTCEMLERDLRSRIESLGLKVKP